MRVRRILLILPLLSAALVAQQSATVVNAGKGWRDDRTKKILVRGQALEMEQPLVADKGAGELLVDCSKSRLVKYLCTDACTVLACTAKSNVKPPAEDHELFEFAQNMITDAVMKAFLTREPREIATLGVRGGGNPTDALLLMDAKGVHWGPALARVLEGRYCLRLTPLPSGAARTVTIDWDRTTDAEGVAPAAGIAAGIYSLGKGTPGTAGGCSVENDARAAWVVIATEAQFSRMNPGWKQQSAEITQLERSDAGPDVAATLRHAVLASLADSAPPK